VSATAIFTSDYYRDRPPVAVRGNSTHHRNSVKPGTDVLDTVLALGIVGFDE
jgi:hypothetical protein